jgi:ATP-dependent helicase/DNAse subunit B
MNGEELIPSLFIEEIGAAKWLSPYEDSLLAPVSAEDAISANLWKQGKISEQDYFVNQPETNILWQELEPGINSALSRSSGPSIYNSWLSDFVATGICTVRSPEYWSASAINEYGKCPFRYWLGRELNLEPHEEPEPGVDIRLRGTLFHRVMEQFYKELFAKQISLADLSNEQRYELLVRVLNRELAVLENEPNFEKDKFWPYVKSDMRFRLARFVEREAQRALKEQQKDINYVPSYFEAGFGRGKTSDTAPVELGNLRFGGIVDRIDVASSGAGQPAKLRIIDYKSSTAYISNQEVVNGSNLQLPLYMMAAEKVVPNAQVLEGYYLSLASGERIGSIDLRKDDHKAIMQKAKQNLSQIVDGIKSGDFAAKPITTTLCPKCDHKTVCRIREIGESKGEGYDETD